MLNLARQPRCRVFIADDHKVLRMGLATLLAGQGSFEVCGEADDGDSAQAMILRVSPDVAIIDLRLKCGDGLELVRTIRTADPKIKILVLSAMDEELYAERSLRAGALGYVNKEAAVPQLLEAIQTVASGKVYLSQRMVQRLLDRNLHGTPPQQKSTLETLSDREMEIFERLGRGQSVKEIAYALQISPKTVEYHRQHIKEKLELSSSAEVVRLATAHSLGLPTESGGAAPVTISNHLLKERA